MPSRPKTSRNAPEKAAVKRKKTPTKATPRRRTVAVAEPKPTSRAASTTGRRSPAKGSGLNKVVVKQVGVKSLAKAEVAAKPVTAKPVTAKPATAKPVTAKLATAKPASATAAKQAAARPAVRKGEARQSDVRQAETRKPEPKPVSTAEPAKRRPGPITTYIRAQAFLQSLSDVEKLRIVRYDEKTFDLTRMRTLLRKLGNPQDKFKSVHVAGTKGKGSTCCMVASMLQANGFKVGLYTSPHLVDLRERIQINQQGGSAVISEADFTRLVAKIAPHITRARPTPSYFDVLTAIAFMYYAEQQVDIAVIETGLGGRLDSTNVLNPEVTALTSISFDHMAQLGRTLTRIAREKAGIFKPGVPAVTVIQDPEAARVIETTAEEVEAPLDVVGKTVEFSYRFEANRMLGRHNRLCLFTPNSRFEHLAVPMHGEHQAINAGLALTVMDKLKSRGFAIDDAKSTEGLLACKMPGRMELLQTNPRVLLDCAHNAASLDALMKAIGQHMVYDALVLIFGCCADKDVDAMLAKITGGADKVIFLPVESVRTADPHDMAQRYAETHGRMAQVAENLDEALAIAARAATRDDLIAITGSFYLVGEAKKHFDGKRRQPVAG